MLFLPQQNMAVLQGWMCVRGACIRLCVCACVRVCVSACVRVCVCCSGRWITVTYEKHSQLAASMVQQNGQLSIFAQGSDLVYRQVGAIIPCVRSDTYGKWI